ncbi:S1-like domain-containing RNA-binding protein, partial [Sedimentibacter sp.]
MIKLGEMQELTVTQKKDFGVYLKSTGSEKSEDKVLLPIKQV